VSVCVVGSLNLDLVVAVDHHPVPGETVIGGPAARHPGGKGANQAVAAARLGQAVSMVGRVGMDEAGETLLAALRGDGVDVRHVRRMDGEPSGIALITVDPAGENAIVVSPGANAHVDAEDVQAADEALAGADVLLLGHEVPAEAVAAAAAAARGRVVLNPAPARPVDPEVLRRVDVLVPNRGELAVLAGARVPADVEEAAALAARLPGVAAVVVTLGVDGAVVVEGGRVERVPAVEADAVDTTAAGDAFCGALADALARGADLVEAARWAARCAAVATTRHGAQPSLPTRDAVEAAATRAR
jgi:ribokinase